MALQVRSCIRLLDLRLFPVIVGSFARARMSPRSLVDDVVCLPEVSNPEDDESTVEHLRFG